MNNIRIQLASNYQVVELTYDCLEEIHPGEINEAVALVNDLGSRVENNAKKTITPKKEPVKKAKQNTMLASEGQIRYAIALGLPEEDAIEMTKEELWKWINANKGN